MKPSTFPHSRPDGFSLIEVVIAIGISTFALLSIFGLFNTSLSANKDASSQQEGLEIIRAIPARLQATNFGSSNFQSDLSALFRAQGGGSTRPLQIFVYQTNQVTNPALPPISTIVVTNGIPSNVAITPGLQFYVLLTRSTNAPDIVFPTNEVDSWPGYPLTASVYQIASWTATNGITNRVPTMIFDFVLPK